MTDTFDVSTIEPSDCLTLEGRELMTAVAYWVLGDALTANTDVRISDAFRHWCREGNGNSKYGFSVDPLGAFRSTNNRYDQPWQSDLEAHVAAWRAKPPAETDELAVRMFDEGMPLYEQQIDPPERNDNRWTVTRRWWRQANDPFIADGRTFREAVFRAAVYRAVSREWERKDAE